MLLAKKIIYEKMWVLSAIVMGAAAFTTVTNKFGINDPEDIKRQ
jgi:hypothetical protein